MDIYRLMFPGKIIFGVGALDALGDEANRLAAKRALIITNPGVYQARLVDPVKERLSGAKLSVDVCAEAEPEPTFTRLNALAEKFRTSKYDLLVGFGGCSLGGFTFMLIRGFCSISSSATAQRKRALKVR
jgi:choline dehydrogenase